MHYQENKYICNVSEPTCFNQKNMMHKMPKSNMQQLEELEFFYPDTYKIVYPMVCSACDMVQLPITRDMICMLTDEIYMELEKNMQIQIDVVARQRDRYLSDLISILLIRELLNRRPKYQNLGGFQSMPFYY